MAILQDPNQQNQGASANQPISGTSAPASGGGPSAGATGPNQAPVSPVQQNIAPQQNQGYTDVSAYLNANPQGGQQIAGQIASNLGNQYNTTKGAIDTSASNLANQVSSGYTPTNQDLISQVAANPTAATPEQTTAFQGQLNDVYGGPNSWADYGNLQGQVGQAQQEAGLVNQRGGQNVLAQQIEGPSTSQGINQLDTLLLQGSPEAQGTIRAAADPFSTLTNYLNTQNTGANQAITAGQQGAQNASQAALNAFTGPQGTLTGLNTQIGNELGTAQTGYNQAVANQAALKAGINGTGLSPTQLQELGITSDQYGALNAARQRASTSQYMTAPN